MVNIVGPQRHEKKVTTTRPGHTPYENYTRAYRAAMTEHVGPVTDGKPKLSDKVKPLKERVSADGKVASFGKGTEMNKLEKIALHIGSCAYIEEQKLEKTAFGEDILGAIKEQINDKDSQLRTLWRDPVTRMAIISALTGAGGAGIGGLLGGGKGALLGGGAGLLGGAAGGYYGPEILNQLGVQQALKDWAAGKQAPTEEEIASTHTGTGGKSVNQQALEGMEQQRV